MCKTKHTNVHTVHKSDTDSSCSDHFYVSEISKNKYKDGLFVPIKLSTGNDTKTLNFKIDRPTGAQVNMIPVKSYRK